MFQYIDIYCHWLRLKYCILYDQFLRKLGETFICFIFIAIPFHYIQLRVSLNAYAFNLTRGYAVNIYFQRYCNKNTDTRESPNVTLRVSTTHEK